MLPPLNALRSFEVSARHLSFTRAAKELNVQQPAVSRQVAELERWLGQPLFIRRKPRLELTNQGQILFSAISSGFEQISQALKSIRRLPDHSQLVVDVSIGIASCWLMARLADFRKHYPKVNLQLITRDSNRGYDAETTDVVVMFGEQKEVPGFKSELLFKETLFPICSNDYLAGKLLSIDELAQEKLLYLTDPYHTSDWQQLFRQTEIEPSSPASDCFYNSYIVYLQAALNGEGIALGWNYLMSDLLHAGRLRVAADISVGTDRGYYCCFFERAKNKDQATVFVDWLLEQVKATPV